MAMQLHGFLDSIAPLLQVGAGQLKQWADEDAIGGYHPNPQLATWESGSLFAVEGQALYAIIRALNPLVVVELGSFWGCSTAHIAAALEANGNGGVVHTVDNGKEGGEFRANGYDNITRHHMDMAVFIENELPELKPALMLEDLDHETENTRLAWSAAARFLLPGGWMISHDAEHWVVGEKVRAGIDASAWTDTVHTALIDPSDCGFAYSVKGGELKQAKPKAKKKRGRKKKAEAASIGEIPVGDIVEEAREINEEADEVLEPSVAEAVDMYAPEGEHMTPADLLEDIKADIEAELEGKTEATK